MKQCADCGRAIKKRSRCLTCFKRIQRKRNPMYASYENLKFNGKRRGKEFSLTFEQFKEFCQLTDYIIKKGVKSRGYTIDRINPDKGYHIDNIQILTNKSNVKKMTLTRENAHSYFFRNASSWANAPPPTPDDDVPF